MASYAMLFITSVYALTVVVIALDLLEGRALRKELDQAMRSGGRLPYVRIFRRLAEAAVLWLIVAFFGQVLMGWISL